MKHTLTLLAALLLAPLAATAAPALSSIRPGQPWLDTQGELINAHGFCILHHEDTYYWYGSHKIPGKTEDEKNEAGVRCYVSNDLLNWRNVGLVLDVFAPGMRPEVRDAFILDRPKVIYHAATKRFILYFKLYPPKEQCGKTGKDLQSAERSRQFGLHLAAAGVWRRQPTHHHLEDRVDIGRYVEQAEMNEPQRRRTHNA